MDEMIQGLSLIHILWRDVYRAFEEGSELSPAGRIFREILGEDKADLWGEAGRAL